MNHRDFSLSFFFFKLKLTNLDKIRITEIERDCAGSRDQYWRSTRVAFPAILREIAWLVWKQLYREIDLRNACLCERSRRETLKESPMRDVESASSGHHVGGRNEKKSIRLSVVQYVRLHVYISVICYILYIYIYSIYPSLVGRWLVHYAMTTSKI